MKRILLLITTVLFMVGCQNANKKDAMKSSNLYYNGSIITMNSDEIEYAEAIVEEKGIIVFVGDLKDAESQYKNAKKIDLKGTTLLPGFIDPHSHFGSVSNTMGQVDLNPAPVGNVNHIQDILKNILDYKTEHQIPDREWIFGWGYDDSQLEELRHPTSKEIDSVLPNNPVFLHHSSGHMGVANSLALEQMNFDANTKNPAGGNIGRYANSQEPNGLVQETAMYPFVGNMLQILASKQGEFFETTQAYYAENGITTAHDGMIDRNTILFYKELAAAGKMKIDLLALAGNSDLEANLNDASLTFKTYENRFKVQGTKIIGDGSPQGKTAYFTEPYLTEVPGCDQDCKGLPSLTQEALNAQFLMAYEKDNQIFVHCNGDATIDMMIEAHEYACEQLNQPLDKDRRTVAIHAQFVRPDQLNTFVSYNILPSFFTNHAYFWGDVHVENLGEERAGFLSPIAAADELGLKYTNHSDATVTPISPLFTVWSAVNRTSRSGKVIGASQKATPYQALKAITSHAAYEYFEENEKGSLSKGKKADFVILNENPLTLAPDEIKNIQVLETIKEGQSIYKIKS